ncbi:MAG TPA: hypothetical protein VK287_01805 [Gaiellaceae bacterium]|nr:hypothetical protein [Gaiellaceae bacterium]
MSRERQRALVAGGAVLVAGLAVGAVALTRLDSGHGSLVETTRVKPARAIPPPPPGALVLAREAGTRAVALAVGQGARPRLIATVLSSSGEPASGLSVSFRAGAVSLPARPCGPGCYTASAPRGALRRVAVALPGREIEFVVPREPRPAAGIIARAARVFSGLRSLVYIESLRSGPKGGLLTTWRLKAPNAVTYAIRGGAAAVIIGQRRWDRDRPGAPWRRSEQIPALRVPQPSWGDVAVNAHVLGTARLGARPVWVVSFANPTTPAWFTAWIERRTYRTLRLRMTAAAHFMRHRYVEFDRPLAIRPPR